MISRKLKANYRSKGLAFPLDFHTHQEYEIFLFHSGNCRFLVGNQIYYLNPGDLLMMDGMTVHRAYIFGDDDKYERSTIHFDAEWIRPLLADLQVDHLLKFFTENRNGLIRTFEHSDLAIIENAFLTIQQLSELDHSYVNEAKRKIALTQLLLTIDSATVKVMDKGQTYQDDKTKIAEAVSDYIFQHYQEPMMIEDIALSLNLSKSYLSHVFKEITGYTIMHYLMSYRLSQARNNLLTDQSRSIKEIAFESGFESDAHFSRYFKQHVGMTPSQYRKNNQNNLQRGDL